MPFLVDAGAVVFCPHGGKAVPQRPSARVTIGGAPAVTVATAWTVACPNVQEPCTLATFAPSSARVLSEGQPVLLADATGACAPNGPPTIAVTQVQVEGG
jgi:hypothetical protein